MGTFKRVDGDFNIETIQDGLGYTGNIVITTDTVHVLGNLDVSGNLTYINVEELNVRDPFILVNSSNTGSYAANSGLLTHRTSTVYAGIRWSEPSGTWQISNSTSTTGSTGTWVNILTGSGNTAPAAGANTEIQFNDGGSLGASANLTFDTSTGNFALQGHQVLGNIGSSPGSVANSTVFYRATIGAGGTGLYAQTPITADEIMSKRRAVALALIL